MSTNIEQIFNNFGDALLYAIEYKGLNASSFSKKSGIDKGQLSNYINNHKTPRPQTVNKIERQLSVRFLKMSDEWQVILDKDAQLAIDSVNRVKELVTAYKASKPKRGEIPELLELRDMIEEDIEDLLKKK